MVLRMERGAENDTAKAKGGALKKKKPKIEQPYRVRFFVTRTYDIEVPAFEAGNARLQAKIKLYEGRGKGFKKGRELWVIESWVDPATATGAVSNGDLTNIGNLDNPLFIVPDNGSSRPHGRAI